MSGVAAKQDPHAGKPVRAAATFRVRWSRKLYGGIGGGALIGIMITGITWFLPRRRSHLPAYSYLAVTDADLHILELAYGSTTTVRRSLGQWPIASLNAEPLDNPWSVRVRLGGRTVELEATTFSQDAAEVVRLLMIAH
jgi:hypothetical protein